DPNLNDKWKFRFNFFDQHGVRDGLDVFNAKHPAWAVMKQLPFGEKLKINTNIWAFFFGFIYLGILGLWQKAILVFGIVVILNVVSLVLPDILSVFFSLVLAGLVARMTNIWYYQKKALGISGWTLK
ncbi:MAG: DUF2628 domain-containing protein, partial [Zoogloeaceae bacterium]|nr:DUF2628 domain-containing protein [Zoogloeaceae bacterium]